MERRGAWPIRCSCLYAVPLLATLLLLYRANVRTVDASFPSRWRVADYLVAQQPAVEPGDPASYHPQLPTTSAAVDGRVLWGRQFLLDGPALERGLSYGDPRRWRRAVARLLAGEQLTFVAVGASITAGAGGAGGMGVTTKWPGYVAQLEHWLRAAFPSSNVSVINAGMGGTSSTVFAACFDAVIPAADVYILEQSIFDGTEPEKCNCKSQYLHSPNRAGVERLIRRMLSLPGEPAVIMLNAYSFFNPSHGVYQQSMENALAVMASYYGLPTISVRAAAWRYMVQGRNGFSVECDAKSLGSSPLPDVLPFYFDIIHPWGPTGHRVMAELVIRMIQATAAVLYTQAPGGADHLAVDSDPLLPPMTPNNYQQNSSTCWLGDNFQHAVSSSNGFTWINERPEAVEKGQQKWGYVALEPGAALQLIIDTRSSQAASEEQSPASSRVLLSYLASYEHMGKAEVRCTSGCSCQPTRIDALWTNKASLLQMHEFQATQHAACQVTVTVLDDTKSDGHKIKLVGVMVLPLDSRDFGGSSGSSKPSGRLDNPAQSGKLFGL